MCGPPPPIKSGGSGGFAPPPLKFGGGGPPKLTKGAAQAPSADSSRALQELNGKVVTAAKGMKEIVFLSPRESPTKSLRSLSPTHIPSLTPSELADLSVDSSTPERVQALERRAFRMHTSPSPELLSDSPASSPESPDSPKKTVSKERIVDEGRNFDVTIETETAPFIMTDRDGREVRGPMLTTSQLTIEQVTEIRHNENPQMNSAVMEGFIRNNIGEPHLQEAKDLFSSVINELAKSPGSNPISVDLQCGRGQFRLIFDKSKNEVLLFNKKHFVEGTEKTVHEAVAIPTTREAEIESRAVLCSKPNMKSLVERSITSAQKLQTEAGENPRTKHIISPPKSEYHSSDGTLIISTERLSGDLIDELTNTDISVLTFQTHLLQGLEGLSLIHDLGYMHCDAKIENMFLKGSTCLIGDLSTCRKQDSKLTEIGRSIDADNTGEDKRSFDLLCLGKSFFDPSSDRDTIPLLRAKPQTPESTAFLDRLEALIPDMTKEDPAKRPNIHEVIARLRG